MKNIIFLLIFLNIVTVGLCYSQSGWFWQNPLPWGHTLKSVRFINTQTGFAVGMSGVILMSTNGGVNWNMIRKNTNDQLSSLYLIDSNSIIAVGSPGVILRSSNKGNNWNSIPSLMTYLNKVFFVNQYSGFISGFYTIMKTTDSGLNWFLPCGNLSKVISGIHFVDENTGWISASYSQGYFLYKEILKSTNGGVNWVSQYLNQVSIIPEPGALFFINQYTGWCYPKLKTTNGGLNWITDDIHFEDIFFIDQQKGWKINSNSYSIFKTTNSGSNWIQFNCGTNSVINLNFFDSLNGFAVGNYGTAIKSNNSGYNWVGVSHGTKDDILHISSIDDNNIWCASSQGTVIRTSDSGNNWTTSFTGDSSKINDIQFVNNTTGFLVNWSGNILKSTNSGINWILNDSFNYIPRSVCFVSQNVGIVGDLGNIKKTTNCGQSWQNIQIANASWVEDIFFINTETGWIASNYLYKTTNAGTNWIRKSNDPNPGSFEKVYFVSDSFGWAIKMNMMLFRTTNAGQTWDNIYYNYGYNIFSIYFLDNLTGIAVGGRYGTGLTKMDIVMKTADGGLNWHFVQSISNEHTWSDAKFNNNGTGWIAGNGGAILKTTNFGGDPIGVVNHSNELPFNFSLSQNYPNPFNPQTKIKFAVPKASFTKIIIYDLLGREVATLVNEELKPGTYEADWDGSNYSSGVYFYKIITGDYTETKKMLMVK